MRYKEAIVNFFIELSYFLGYLYLTWDTSGGDIFLWFIYVVTILIHLIIVVIVFFKRKQSLVHSLIGMGIALIISFLIFKVIEYSKTQIKPTIETSKVINDILDWNEAAIDAFASASVDKIFGRFNKQLEKAFDANGLKGDKLTGAMEEILQGQKDFLESSLKAAISEVDKEKTSKQ